jgi:hypothetical protein
MMQHLLSSLMVGYWAGLHGGPGAQASGTDDAVLRAISPNVFVLRPSDDCGGQFLAAGSAVRKFFPEHLLKSDILDYWQVMDQRLIKSLIRQLHHDALPLLLTAEVRAEGASPVSVELAMMPVGVKRGKAALILGLFAILDDSDELEMTERLWLIRGNFFGQPSSKETTFHTLESYR